MKYIHKFFILLALIPIRFYQWFISPFTPASCRHVPTCSEYAIIAIKKHGAIKGIFLATRRLSKCHPWGTSGYDPVPPRQIKVKKYNH